MLEPIPSPARNSRRDTTTGSTPRAACRSRTACRLTRSPTASSTAAAPSAQRTAPARSSWSVKAATATSSGLASGGPEPGEAQALSHTSPSRRSSAIHGSKKLTSSAARPPPLESGQLVRVSLARSDQAPRPSSSTHQPALIRASTALGASHQLTATRGRPELVNRRLGEEARHLLVGRAEEADSGIRQHHGSCFVRCQVELAFRPVAAINAAQASRPRMGHACGLDRLIKSGQAGRRQPGSGSRCPPCRPTCPIGPPSRPRAT